MASWYEPSRFTDSEISGSTLVSSSPELFAAVHVLHRLSMPRHPPRTLHSLTVSLRHVSKLNTIPKTTAKTEVENGHHTIAVAWIFYSRPGLVPRTETPSPRSNYEEERLSDPWVRSVCLQYTCLSSTSLVFKESCESRRCFRSTLASFPEEKPDLISYFPRLSKRLKVFRERSQRTEKWWS